MAGAQIMIVEDEGITAQDLRRRLLRLGYEIPAMARSGEEAIEKAAHYHPDLVLMDIRLQGKMDGIDAADQIRTRFDVPIAYLTAYADEGTIERARHTAPIGYVLKPFREQELHAVIQTALERHRLERAVRAERRWLHTVLTAAGDAIIAADREGKVHFMNPVAETLTGWQAQEACGHNITDVFRVAWPALRPTSGNRDGDRDPDPAQSSRLREVVLTARDGRQLPIEESATVARDESNEVVGFVWAFHDISERRRAEQEKAELLRAREEELEVSAALARVGRELMSAFDTPGLLQCLCRVTSEVLPCERSYTWMYDSSENAFLPMAGHGDSAEEWETIRVLKLPLPERSEVIDRLGSGEVFRIDPDAFASTPAMQVARRFGITSCLAVPLRRGGRLVGVHTACFQGQRELAARQQRIAEGISQFASLALEHARVVNELQDANRLKSDFVAAMSHELRTPVSSALGYADLLLRGEYGPLSEEQAEAVRRILRRSRELSELIEGTLEVSRLQAGQVPLYIEEVKVADLLRTVAADESDVYQKPGVALQWNVEPRLPRLHTDVVKLKVILKNLISNAVKFTMQGRVRVEAAREDGGVAFTVSDTGIGIPADAISAIFEPFRQLEPSSTRRFAGVGLGLYIARRLSELLGGSIDVQSQPGRGSTFRVCCPCASNKPGAGTLPEHPSGCRADPP